MYLCQILSYPNKGLSLLSSAFKWCINLNFKKLTLMTGFVVHGHILHPLLPQITREVKWMQPAAGLIKCFISIHSSIKHKSSFNSVQFKLWSVSLIFWVFRLLLYTHRSVIYRNHNHVVQKVHSKPIKTESTSNPNSVHRTSTAWRHSLLETIF